MDVEAVAMKIMRKIFGRSPRDIKIYERPPEAGGRFHGGWSPVLDPNARIDQRLFLDAEAEFWRLGWEKPATFCLGRQSPYFNLYGLYWRPLHSS